MFSNYELNYSCYGQNMFLAPFFLFFVFQSLSIFLLLFPPLFSFLSFTYLLLSFLLFSSLITPIIYFFIDTSLQQFCFVRYFHLYFRELFSFSSRLLPLSMQIIISLVETLPFIGENYCFSCRHFNPKFYIYGVKNLFFLCSFT